MLAALLPLLLFQSSDLTATAAKAQAFLDKGDAMAAVKILEDAGAVNSKNTQALTVLGVAQLRRTEALIAAGKLRGLQINDGFLEAAWTLEAASMQEVQPPKPMCNGPRPSSTAGTTKTL